MNVTKYKINCAAPRLSDEEPDLLEQEDIEGISAGHGEGWLPWSHDDIIDIRRVIDERMPQKQKEILEAYLQGYTAADLGVTEKYWRYHFKRGVEFIKKEFKV